MYKSFVDEVFVVVGYCRRGVLSSWGIVVVGFCRRGVLSSWGFVVVGYCRRGVLSSWGFVVVGFCRRGVLSSGALSVFRHHFHYPARLFLFNLCIHQRS